MCRRLCVCPSIKVPHQFAALSRWERVLFALAVCAAIAVNGWLLHRNLQRMWEAERSPVSQISQRQVDQFPDFIIAVQVFTRSSAPIQCIQTRRFFANDSVVDERPCNMETFIDSVDNRLCIIKPLRQFLPNDPVFYSFLDIFYANSSSSDFELCVMDPSQRDRFLYTTWQPFDACHVFPAGDNKEYAFALDASATQFPNNTKQFDFRLAEVFSGYDRSLISFANFDMNPSVTWNTLTVAYQLTDVAASSASFISLTLAIFAFVFPIVWTGKPQYSFRFRPPTSARSAKAMASERDHMHGFDAESGLADAADPLTMRDFLPAP